MQRSFAGARLRPVRGDEAALRVRDADDEAPDRRAVDVHVQRREEDRDPHGRTDERIV